MTTLNHKQLVDIGYKYLSTKLRIKIIATEFVTAARETPDIIGWKDGMSILIECKTSLSDFKRDKKKYGARTGNKMGNARFYLCPRSLASTIIDKDLLPQGWGLISVGKKLNPSVIIEATYTSNIDITSERIMLTSALRRVGAAKLTTDLNNYKITKKEKK